MKKTNILIVLGLLILLFGTAQPAYAGLAASWIPSVNSYHTGSSGLPGVIDVVAQLNAATSKFEGLLNAYTSPLRCTCNGEQNIENQLLTAANDLSSSLDEFNTVLSEIYPDLTEEEQLAIDNAYSSLEVYFEDLFAKANSVFDKELFWIEYGEPLDKTSNSTTQGRFIAIIDDLNSDV